MTDDRIEQSAQVSAPATGADGEQEAGRLEGRPKVAAAESELVAERSGVVAPPPAATDAVEDFGAAVAADPQPSAEFPEVTPSSAGSDAEPPDDGGRTPDARVDEAVDVPADQPADQPAAEPQTVTESEAVAAVEVTEVPTAEVPTAEVPKAEVPKAEDAATPEPPAETEPAAAADPASEPEPAVAATRPAAGGPGTAVGRSGRPGPPGRPGGPRPRPAAGPKAAPPTVVEPTVEPVDPHLWGRIDEAGVVYVRTASGERVIGNWQAGDAEAGLSHFGVRFDDFVTEIALLEARLASGSGDPRQTKQQATTLRESAETLAAIGDLDSAAARLEIVIGAADAAIAGASAARAKARADSVAAKERLCVEAEELAASNQWKSSGDRFKAIVDEWRSIKGIDRKTDDALWKRFARARDTFTRNRGSHFAELDKQRGAAREVKESLIKKAEELSGSSDWGDTAAAYRTLMEEWKAAGRAPREVEDELWERFRAAQEAFFARRNQTFATRDAEYDTNAAAKEKLLAEAKSIDPDADIEAAKASLRSVQERWEAIGKVPRERIRDLDGRLKAIEDRVRAASEVQWRRTDPATAARVEQFRARAQTFRDQAARARAAGDERRAAEAEEQAATWEQWLETARSSAQR